MELTYHIATKDQGEEVALHGAINEEAEVLLPQILDKLSMPSCLITFKGVSSINSCGVRAWINFIRDLCKKTKVTYVECTPEVVSQINMIPSFKGEAKIQSVHAGFSCASCDHQQLVLFEEGKNMPASKNVSIPPKKCDKCGADMEMEELEEEFFSWLK